MRGWLRFIDVEEVKPKSLKQMEADDPPVTLDDKIIDDHFFREVFLSCPADIREGAFITYLSWPDAHAPKVLLLTHDNLMILMFSLFQNSDLFSP